MRVKIRHMPGWSVALLVAFVGLVGGLIGTFGRIAYDREADLRTRMLDAADDFVVAAIGAAESVSLAALPMMLDVRFGWQFGEGSPHQTEHRTKAEGARETSEHAWRVASERLPRLRLLFGVDSVAATSARAASDAIGEAVIALAELRGFGFEHEGDEATLEAKTDEVFEFVHSRAEDAKTSADDFSRAARRAITESRWARAVRMRAERRAGHRETSNVQPAFEQPPARPAAS